MHLSVMAAGVGAWDRHEAGPVRRPFNGDSERQQHHDGLHCRATESYLLEPFRLRFLSPRFSFFMQNLKTPLYAAASTRLVKINNIQRLKLPRCFQIIPDGFFPRVSVQVAKKPRCVRRCSV